MGNNEPVYTVTMARPSTGSLFQIELCDEEIDLIHEDKELLLHNMLAAENPGFEATGLSVVGGGPMG